MIADSFCLDWVFPGPWHLVQRTEETRTNSKVARGQRYGLDTLKGTSAGPKQASGSGASGHCSGFLFRAGGSDAGC